MKTSSEKNPFEEKVRAMAEGFRAFPFPNTQLVFRGETLLPAQAAARFQGILDSFQGVRDAAAAHRGAVDAHEKELADQQAFYEDAVVAVKSHFGSDPKRLSSFGLGPTKKGRRGPGRQRQTVIERRTEEVIAGTDGTVKVVETEEVIDPLASLGAVRREEPTHPRMGPGAIQVVAPPAPASVVPKPTTPATTPAGAAARKARKPVQHRQPKREPRARSRGR